MATMEINKGAAMCYMWTGLQTDGETATYFIKVSLEQRVQGKGRLYMAGV